MIGELGSVVFVSLNQPLLDYHLPFAVGMRDNGASCPVFIVAADPRIRDPRTFPRWVCDKNDIGLVTIYRRFGLVRVRSASTCISGRGLPIARPTFPCALKALAASIRSEQPTLLITDRCLQAPFLVALKGLSTTSVVHYATLQTAFPKEVFPLELMRGGPIAKRLLVNVPEHKERAQDCFDTRAIPVGYPKAGDRFRRMAREYAEAAELPGRFVVIFARGPRRDGSHAYFDNQALEQMVFESFRALREVFGDTPILVKPHPRQDSRELTRHVVCAGGIISELPTPVLASNAIAGVAYFSSAVIDLIVNGIPAVHYLKPSPYLYEIYPELKRTMRHYGVPVLTSEEQLRGWLEEVATGSARQSSKSSRLEALTVAALLQDVREQLSAQA